MSARYAVLSNILSDSSVAYDVYDMAQTYEGPVYEGVDIMDAIEKCEEFNRKYVVTGELQPYTIAVTCDDFASGTTRAHEIEEDDGDNMTDAEADADTLRSAGWGTDEDYGGCDERY